MLAHIGGIPAEETALSLAPVATAIVGCTWLRLRRALHGGASLLRPVHRRRAAPAPGLRRSIKGGLS